MGKKLARLLLLGPGGMILIILLIFMLFLLPITAMDMGDGGDTENASSGTSTVLDEDKLPAEARKWAPWIEKAGSICAESPAPLIAAQIERESTWNPTIVNESSGATGLAQFISGTWKTYGEDVNNNNGGKAERTDPPDAIMALGKYNCAIVKEVRKMFAGTYPGSCRKFDTPGNPLIPPPKAGEMKEIRPMSEYMLAGYNAGECRVAAWRDIPGYENGKSVAGFSETKEYVKWITERAMYYAKVMANGEVGEMAASVISLVNAQIGKRYTQEDPQSPNHGFDCSGLLQWAFNKGTNGQVKPPRTTYQQVNFGQPVTFDELMPGDVIVMTFFENDPDGHIGIYIGAGNMVHAASTKRGIVMDQIFNPETKKPVGKTYTSNRNSWKFRRWIQANVDNEGGYALPTTDYVLSAYFNQAGRMWSSGHHTGQDFALKSGSKAPSIRSAGPGTVVKAVKDDGGPYGNHVVIRHPSGYTTLYAHFSGPPKVSKGQTVSGGTVLGTMGETGNVTGVHLHFEVRTDKGVLTDPMDWLKSKGLKP